MDEKLKRATSDLKSKIADEAGSRTKEIEGIKKDMARLPRGGGGGAQGPVVLGPSKEEFEAVSHCLYFSLTIVSAAHCEGINAVQKNCTEMCSIPAS